MLWLPSLRRSGGQVGPESEALSDIVLAPEGCHSNQHKGA
jgi:hypothetical protein